MLKPTHSGVSSHAFISTFASQGFVCPIPQSPTRLMSFPGASWFFTKMYSFPREMQRSSEERKRPFTSAIRSDVNSRAQIHKVVAEGRCQLLHLSSRLQVQLHDGSKGIQGARTTTLVQTRLVRHHVAGASALRTVRAVHQHLPSETQVLVVAVATVRETQDPLANVHALAPAHLVPVTDPTTYSPRICRRRRRSRSSGRFPP